VSQFYQNDKRTFAQVRELPVLASSLFGVKADFLIGLFSNELSQVFPLSSTL
jgi:hypothetical protein